MCAEVDGVDIEGDVAGKEDVVKVKKKKKKSGKVGDDNFLHPGSNPTGM